MKRLLSISLASLLATTACKGGNSSATTSPSATTTTDTFNGTVQVRGSAVHSFTVSQSGQVSVTLTAAGPPSTIVMGVGVGTPGDSTCGVIAGASAATPAGATAQVTGVVSPGTLCVAVYDVGNQTAAVTYSVTVVHP